MTHQRTEDRGQRTEVLCAAKRHVYINSAAQPRQRICPLSSVLCPLISVLCLLSSVAHAAEEARPAYTPPPPAVSSGSIVQIIFSLLLVLAAIVLVAWLLKRMNLAQQGSVRLLKVLGGVAIGQRERIVLVEVNDTWLVVGVGPGQIRTLHTLQKPDGIEQDATMTPQSADKHRKFSAALSSALGSLSSGKHKQQLAADANTSEVNASDRSHHAP